jgi:hypothetical protein
MIEGIEPGVTDAPVVIFGFDRPHYLDRLCAGLAAQMQLRPDPARVFLMLDGAVSRRTGHRYASRAKLAESEAVFRRHFPEGEVHAARHNLGIADNVLRGQRHAFETLGAEIAWFFEDDLEPGPLYLAALEAMRRATQPHADRVAFFAAYGDPKAPAAGPEVGWTALGHLWGYGLRAGAFRRVQEQLAWWWPLIRANDYPARNRLRTLRMMRAREHAVPGDSQDAIADLACWELGLAKLNSTVSFARYIGPEGENFTPHVFEAMGFASMRWAEGERFAFLPLEAALLDHIVDRQRDSRRVFRRRELQPLIARIEAERGDPDRLVTAEEVAQLWLLLLDRRAVPPEVLAAHVGRTTLRALRRAIVRMPEFQRATGP